MENTSHDVFGPNEMDDFSDLAKMLIRHDFHSHLFRSALQFSSRWQRPYSLTEEKKVTNDGEGKEVETKEDEVIEVDQTPLLYARGPGHCHQNPWIKRLKHTNVVEHAVHFWRKGPSFSDVVDNVNSNAP